MPKAAKARHWLNAIVGVAALSAGVAGSSAAKAQFFFDTWGGTFERRWDDGPPPRYRERDLDQLDRADVRALLARRGYRIDAPIARNADVYIVQVVDASGRRLRLIVDAYDGSILRRSEASLAAPPPPRERDFEDDFFDAPARPPRDVPGERMARPDVGPEVIPGVGPAPRAQRPEPRRPTTARVEPKPAAPKPPAAEKPVEAAPTPPAEAAKAAPPAKPAESASRPAPAVKPDPRPQQAEAAPAKADDKPAAAPRVIPLYKKPDETPAGAAAADAQK